MDGSALRLSLVVRTASTLSSERKGSRRGLSEKWSLGTGPDSQRHRASAVARLLPFPKPTVDRPLSLPTFKVDSMGNGALRASAILAVGTRLGLRSTAQAVA
jgi:hypothetical protein